MQKSKLEQLLAAVLSAPEFGLAAGVLIAAVIWLTPGPVVASIRTQAAAAAIITVPAAVAAAAWLTPLPRSAATESSLTLVAGAAAGLVAGWLGGFQRPRSRLLFAMAVGVAVAAVITARPG